MCHIEGDRVALTFTPRQHFALHMTLGYALGERTGTPRFYELLEFVNEMNRENPGYTPYEIPAKPVQ